MLIRKVIFAVAMFVCACGPTGPVQPNKSQNSSRLAASGKEDGSVPASSGDGTGDNQPECLATRLESPDGTTPPCVYDDGTVPGEPPTEVLPDSPTNDLPGDNVVNCIKEDGSTFPAGVTFPSLDGCNTCSCLSDGSVVCTEIACAP